MTASVDSCIVPEAFSASVSATDTHWDVIVVGAGVAGLRAATLLHRAGKKVLVIDAMERPGGRVATDCVDGFVLDRGFQVVLTAYPELQRAGILPMLGLKPFMSGALIRYQGRFVPLLDPLRHPWQALLALPKVLGAMGAKGFLSWRDVWRVACLRWQVTVQPESDCWNALSQSTADFLSQYGFSAVFIQAFFRPFFGGVFLDAQLATSARLFRFLFRQFCLGRAALPAGSSVALAGNNTISVGMASVVAQLAAEFPENQWRLNMRVLSVAATHVVLESGETLHAQQVVWAAPSVKTSCSSNEPLWRSTTCLYYQVPSRALPKVLSMPWLVLNGDGMGLINTLCVPTLVQPAYKTAGTDGHLLSVSLIGVHPNPKAAVEAELGEWFGADCLAQWRWLKTQVIPEALPALYPHQSITCSLKNDAGVWHCGDGTTYPSLNGALASGRCVAEAILLEAT